MKTYIKIFLLALMVLNIGLTKAQDTRYTQVLNNPMRINPALISASNDMRVLLTHRSQWQHIDNGIMTPSFTFVYPIFLQKDKWKEDRGNAKLDIGLNVINDRIGAYEKYDAMLSVSAALRISKNQFMSIALYGGYIQQSLNYADLTFDSQYLNGSYDPGLTPEPVAGEMIQMPDAGFGIVWNYSPDKKDVPFNAYAGMSGYHMNQYNATYLEGGVATVPVRMVGQAGFRWLMLEKMELGAHMIYHNQASVDQLIFGILAGSYLHNNGKLVYGGWYKQYEAIALQLGYEHQNFLFAFSWDFITAEAGKAMNNLLTYEISLGYKLPMAKRKGYFNPVFF